MRQTVATTIVRAVLSGKTFADTNFMDSVTAMASGQDHIGFSIIIQINLGANNMTPLAVLIAGVWKVPLPFPNCPFCLNDNVFSDFYNENASKVEREILHRDPC